jgi:hypothetical protein
METIVLMGAEDVQKAGYAMREAAADMMRAAGEIREALEATRRWHDEWIASFERLPAPDLSDEQIARIGAAVLRGQQALAASRLSDEEIDRLGAAVAKAFLDAPIPKSTAEALADHVMPGRKRGD